MGTSATQCQDENRYNFDLTRTQFDEIRGKLEVIAALDSYGQSVTALDTYDEINIANQLINSYKQRATDNHCFPSPSFLHRATTVIDLATAPYLSGRSQSVSSIEVATNLTHDFSLFSGVSFFNTNGNPFFVFHSHESITPFSVDALHLQNLTYDLHNAKTAEEERKALVKVLQGFDVVHVDAVCPTFYADPSSKECHDKGSWQGNDLARISAEVFGNKMPMQTDCVFEMSNTQDLLYYLFQNGFLKFHKVNLDDFSLREEPAYGTYHLAAVIVEADSNTRYTVDTWQSDLAQPCEIKPEETWKREASQSRFYNSLVDGFLKFIEFYKTQRTLDMDSDNDRVFSKKDIQAMIASLGNIFDSYDLFVETVSGEEINVVQFLKENMDKLPEVFTKYLVEIGLKEEWKKQFDMYEAVDPSNKDATINTPIT